MQIDYIEQYVSTCLHTEVSVYDGQTKALLRRILPMKEFRSVLAQCPALSDALLSADACNQPLFTSVNEGIWFVHFGVCSMIYIIGPMRFLFDGNAMHARHKLQVDAFCADEGLPIPDQMPLSAAECILLLYNIHQDRSLTAAECFQLNFSNEESKRQIARLA